MMFLGTTRKAAEIQPEQKWDAISLRDFHSSSFFTYLAYGYLHFSILLSLTVYGVDIFTGINLLAFDQWSSSIEPTQLLTRDQTKWIFAGAIIATFVNLIFEHLRAWRVMRRGSVAECYLDNLAVRLESVRFGSGQGWRRFLVFAELTKSKKGAEYVALFSYFSLQSWIRVLVCSGPRQAVNALTLYGIYILNLTPDDSSSFESTIGGFFSNIKALAGENTRQAVILSGMLFTLVIWVFSFLFLLAGILFYVFFLWHYIPRQDGGLHGYCERKANKRLKSIVTKKINKALAKEDLKWTKTQGKATDSAGGSLGPERQATLPLFMDVEKGDALPEMPMLNRNDTMATLPAYTSRPGSIGSMELGALDQKRPIPSRQATNATTISNASYSSRAPLVASAAEMGFDRSASPAPSLPNLDYNAYQGPPRLGMTGPNGSFDRLPPMNALRSQNTLPSMPERARSPASPYSMNGRPASPYSMNGRASPSHPFAEGRSIAGPSPATTQPAQQQRYPPQRNMTAPQPMRQEDDYYQGNTGRNTSQARYGVAGQDNPTVHGLKQAHGYRVMKSPLIAFGALDVRGRPWATVWGGEKGFCRPVAEDVLAVNGIADAKYDPVVQALFAIRDVNPGKSNSTEGKVETDEGEKEGHIVDDEVIRPKERRAMAGLAIDLETRDRVKLAGHFIAGAATGTTPGVANLQMAFGVEEALGNCPKYLNKKHIVPHIPDPELVRNSSGPAAATKDGLPLPREAVELIAKADLFFIASKHGNGSMDMNHRGGAAGFLRVFQNQESNATRDTGGGDGDRGGVILVYPEYSGNRLYQTLGNLDSDPVAGLVIPDFETGDVLYLTGRTQTLVAERAAAYMPRTKLAVRLEVMEARFVRNGLPFRGDVIDYSPYNPPVRLLSAEKKGGSEEEDEATNAIAMATLLRRHIITPTISRYVFRLTPTAKTSTMSKAKQGNRQAMGERKGLQAWYPGQHVTLDFSSELDHGYSHMRDEDPQSLNDDFVRTFTVSAPIDPTVIAHADPPRSSGGDNAGEYANAIPVLDTRALRDGVEPEFEIVARRHGAATALLAHWNPRAPIEIPVLGFGGVEEFRLPVLWSLRSDDLPLAADVFTRIHDLGSVTKLFVTGSLGNEDAQDLLAKVKSFGALVVEGRMKKDDVLAAGQKGKRKFYGCTGPAMMKELLHWLEGEEVVFESFEY
ncbi:hypothetical protein F4808DRAFT_448723 [Astrocystis sublimbata]|nr:hypothetical protein F4808DRAFT_448723 [Astrocystis sublimbata]